MAPGRTRHERRYAPLLSALRDDDLGRIRAALLRRHVARCAACQKVMKELDEQVASLRRAAGAPAGPSGADEAGWRALHAALRAGERQAGRRRLPQRPGSMVLAAAAALVLASFGLPRLSLLLARAPSDDVMISLAEEQFHQVDQQYQIAIEELFQIAALAQRGRTQMQTQLFEAQIRMLQGSTEQYRQVARIHPADEDAQELLYTAYRRQIAYLQDSLQARAAQAIEVAY